MKNFSFRSLFFKRTGYFSFFRILFSIVLSLPFVLADECSWLNIGDCITNTLFGFLNSLFFSPIQALVIIVRNMMTETVNLSNFSYMWAVIVYVLSLFYGLLILYAGVNFMLSGHDAVKRAKSKEWFQNIFIMIVLVQMSYYIYGVFVGVNAGLTSIVMNRINMNFFSLATGSIANLAMSIIFSFLGVTTLLVTILLYGLRYVIINVGLIFFPIAIFLYFIPSMQEYGKSIINFLLTSIFISFFSALIVYVCSQGAGSSAISSYGILITITAFSLVNFMMFYFLLLTLLKSALSFTTKILVLTKILG